MNEDRVILKRQLSRFLVAGISAVAMDFSVYYFLINNIDYSVAKGTSFLAGTVVAFAINKYWTFEKKESSIREALLFLVLYLVTMVANIAVNRAVLSIDSHLVFVGFLLATGTSTVLNFIGQKWLVFRV